ncbi:DUF397 domain-containing protein [Fodinicola feengrottensis]|uniref:DUF397 domain-containing protein n=1 Tax=Fodinicola feengrottensis TaxID=435914 RepID=UPI0013D797EA
MLAPTWRKSRRSQSDNNCVEVADVPRILLVRDSKLGEQSPLIWASTQLGGVLS